MNLVIRFSNFGGHGAPKNDPTAIAMGHLAKNDLTAIANTQIDWKEAPEAPDAHTFKADPPGLKKDDVKKEVEDDRIFYSIDWVSQFWVVSSSSAHHSF